jgi:Cation efflux family
MVGRRHQFAERFEDGHETKVRDDLEQNDVRPAPKRTPAQRFRDIAATSIADARRTELKRLLKTGIEGMNYQDYRKSDGELKKIGSGKLRKFYEAQNEQLDDMLEVDALVLHAAEGIIDSMNPDADRDGIAERVGALQEENEQVEQLLPDEQREKRRKGARNARWAININVIANILLLVAKIIAALTTSSLSLIASLVDSALDLLVTVIIWSTNRLVGWRLDALRVRFPVGRKRLEPLGILVFSIIMILSFAQILQESAMKLLPGGDHEVTNFPSTAVAAMVATIVIKGIIWFGCIPIKTTQVQALAQGALTLRFANA